MTRAKISEYSATANDNTDVNGVNIAEGCPPSSMNNMGREIMAALKRFQMGSDGDGVTVGGSLVVSGSTSVNTFNVDVISEKTSAAGVTIDGVLLKDSGVVTGAGTVSAPVYSTTGDLNTGIFFPAADTIAFAEGGAEAMRIDSSGRVGIGTTSPTWKTTIVNGSVPRCLQISQLTTNNADKYSFISAGHYTNTTYTDGFALIGGVGTAANNAVQIGGGIGESLASSVIQFFTAADTTTAAGTERMRIDSSGNVGIGTTTPGYLGNPTDICQLSINRVPSSGVITNTGRSCALINLDGSSGGSSIQFGTAAANNTAPTERARITSGGEVYIAGTTDQGAYNLQCNGTGVWGAGAYVNGSDARIKEDVAPIDSGLDVVEKLNPVTYRYKEDWSKDQSVQTGFIAQELLVAMEGQNYVDGIVQQGGSEGYYSVAYQNIIPLLTKAIQEQQAIIESLKSRIEALETK